MAFEMFCGFFIFQYLHEIYQGSKNESPKFKFFQFRLKITTIDLLVVMVMRAGFLVYS